MISLKAEDFERQSLIELVCPPHVNYCSVISELLYKEGHLIILDTQGNLFKEFGSSGWSLKESNTLQKVEYSFISSLNDLFNKLEAIRKYKNIVLIIDSITFIGDRAPNSVKSLSKALWAIIYDCNSTVIAINQYRIGKEKRTYKLVPRMGQTWEQTISYRVKLYYKFNSLNCTISKTPFFEEFE